MKRPVLAGVAVIGLAVFAYYAGTQSAAPNQEVAGGEDVIETSSATNAVGGDVTQPKGVIKQDEVGASGVLTSPAAVSNHPQVVTLGQPSQLEQALIPSGYIGEQAQRSLRAQSFDQVVTEFEQADQGRHGNRSAQYRSAIEQSLAAVGARAQIERLACGANVCMGAIRESEQDDGVAQWLPRFPAVSPLPVRALTSEVVRLPGGGSQYRVLFTTSGPAGIQMPAPRSGPA